ncbi:hypothetical protein [Heliobacterium chlorum]|uniref:hypothetical protein n=1 Tax=Heliobacterium chlorum TaxID=2698 RepID=UPI001FACCC4D|nr:hypothetical protein [Heliobacterium chlorum]
MGNQYARSHYWPWQKAFWAEFFDVSLSYLFLKHHKDKYLGPSFKVHMLHRMMAWGSVDINFTVKSNWMFFF